MSELEQPAPQESETAPADELESSQVDEVSETESETVDVDDYEYEGEKYQVPKKLSERIKALESGNLRQEDYTQKTQSVAEEKRALEAVRQEFAARQQFQQEHLEKIADIRAIDRQLEQYSKLDWAAITDADPVQAMKLDRQMRDLQQQRIQQVQSIEQAQAKQTFETQQATARRLQEAHAELSREIKGFGTPEVMKALKDTGLALGFKHEELTNVNDPRAVRMLHEAYLYRKLVAQKSAPETLKEVKPITRVSGASASVQKSIGDASLSDAEYNRMRREYISKNR
mgnify:FL=1